MFDIVIAFVFAAFAAELFGYFIHIILHSNKIEFLSTGHMIHHLKIYGPTDEMRAKKYTSSVAGRGSIFGVGLEWILPSAVVIASYLVLFWYFNIALHLAVIVLAVTFSWLWFFFSYMHKSMHLENFWMIKNKYLSKWFLGIREFHDIHHIELTNDGRMNKNYGICFFLFDKLFGSMSRKMKKFNENGYKAARKRYAFIYKD